jgi:hypothetical protein
VQAERLGARLTHASWDGVLPPDLGAPLAAHTATLRDLAGTFSPLESATPSYRAVHDAARQLAADVTSLASTVAAYVYLQQWEEDEDALRANRPLSMLHPSVQTRCDILFSQVCTWLSSTASLPKGIVFLCLGLYERSHQALSVVATGLMETVLSVLDALRQRPAPSEWLTAAVAVGLLVQFESLLPTSVYPLPYMQTCTYACFVFAMLPVLTTSWCRSGNHLRHVAGREAPRHRGGGFCQDRVTPRCWFASVHPPSIMLVRDYSALTPASIAVEGSRLSPTLAIALPPPLHSLLPEALQVPSFTQLSFSFTIFSFSSPHSRPGRRCECTACS